MSRSLVAVPIVPGDTRGMRLRAAATCLFGIVLDLVVGAVTLAILAAGERAARKQ